MSNGSKVVENPISSSIPKQLLHTVFNNQFDKSWLGLSHKKLSEINKSDLPQDKRQAFTLLMLLWPGRPLSEYCELLARHDLEPEQGAMFFISAAFNRVDCLEALKQEKPDEITNLLAFESYYAFVVACDSGHREAMDWLRANAEMNFIQNDMVTTQSYWPFGRALENRDFETLQWFKDNTQLFETIVKDAHYAFIAHLSKNNDLQMLEWITSRLGEDEKTAMLKEMSNTILRNACFKGNLEIIEWLMSLKAWDEKEKSALITSGYNQVYCTALDAGHSHILAWLQKNAKPEEWVAMTMEKASRVFLSANFEQRRVLLRKASPAQKNAYLEAHDYQAFHQAAMDFDPAQIEFLFQEANQEQRDAMLSQSDYFAFRQAALHGRIDIMLLLANHATAEQWKAMITADDFAAFKETYSSTNHYEVLNWLLLEPICLDHIERHVQQYGPVVNAFLKRELSDLHSKHREQLQDQPGLPFDLNPNAAEFHYYMLRNFIRRNDRQLDEDIQFLLKIPAIRALAAKDNNALLRLAREKSHIEAIKQLRTIPEVGIIESTAHHEDLDSSPVKEIKPRLKKGKYTIKTILFDNEEKKLAAVIANYQPKITEDSLENIVLELRKKLEEQYAKNPVSIIRNGQKENLPLVIPDNASQEILEAYYQNPNHTAWRYLSTCNSDLHALIAMYYLAAIDETQPPTDGYTLESRLNYFIYKLALIGRAGNKAEEETPSRSYQLVTNRTDDMAKDKPASIAGAKTELFESVVGHPLITIFVEKVRNDIRKWAFDEVTALVDEQNIKDISKECRNYIHSRGDKDKIVASLSALNIPAERQERLQRNLINRYGEDSAEDIKAIIADAFSLSPTDFSYANRCHALKLCNMNQLYEYLKQQQQQQQQQVRVHNHTAPDQSPGQSPVRKKSKRDAPLEEITAHLTSRIVKGEVKKMVMETIFVGINDKDLQALTQACDVLSNDKSSNIDKEKAAEYLYSNCNISESSQRHFKRNFQKKYNKAFNKELQKVFADTFDLSNNSSYLERSHLLSVVGLPQIQLALENIHAVRLDQAIERWAIRELHYRLENLAGSEWEAVLKTMISETDYPVLRSLSIIGVSAVGKKEFEELLQEHQGIPWDDKMYALVTKALTKDSSSNPPSAVNPYSLLTISSPRENKIAMGQKLQEMYQKNSTLTLPKNFAFFTLVKQHSKHDKSPLSQQQQQDQEQQPRK